MFNVIFDVVKIIMGFINEDFLDLVSVLFVIFILGFKVYEFMER